MYRYIKYSFGLVVILYTIVATVYFLGKPIGSGDEALFLNDLDFIASQGWIEAIKKGISIPYMILCYPLTTFLEPVIALRGVNVILFMVLLLYFYKIRKVKNPNFYLLLLFYYSTVGFFLLGTNDTLFIVALAIFFSECHFIIRSKNGENTALAWSALVLAIFTRSLFIVFIPAILLPIFLLIRTKKLKASQLKIPIAVFTLFVLLNVPSLIENNRLSFDQKLPPSGVEATWGQRQYYAQLLVNEGSLKNYQHPSWKVTDAYLAAHGAESLPKSIFSGMFFDIELTIKEFFKELFDIQKFGFRQLGPILPIVVVFGLYSLFKQRRFTSENYIPIALIVSMAIFALIIISYIELRWLAPIFIATVLYFTQMLQERKIPFRFMQIQMLVVIAFSFYGGYGLLTKLL